LAKENDKWKNALQFSEANLAERTASVIREMFLNGELEPGQRIIEADLAEQLNLSRGPVRDAFKILEKEGVVRIVPRRGTFVAELTLEDVREVYLLRGVLEGLAARIIAENGDDVVIAELVEIMNNMVSSKDTFLEFAKHDLNFHETLCRLSGHRWLYKQWLSMKTYYWLFIRASQVLDAPGNEQVIRLHKDIIDTIKARLPEASELVTRRHSEIVGEEIRLRWQIEGWTGSALFPLDE